MWRMNKHFIIAVLAFIGVTAMGCSATAHIEKDETVNFSNYKTFAWVGETEKTLKDRNSNSILDANLKNTVRAALEKNGWREDAKNPDVLLDYNILVENQVEQRTEPVYTRPFTRYFYNPYTRRIIPVHYPSQMVGYESYEIPYKEGTVTLHMIDKETNKLVWQGWTSEPLNSRNIGSREVQSIVKTIMKKFKTQG